MKLLAALLCIIVAANAQGGAIIEELSTRFIQYHLPGDAMPYHYDLALTPHINESNSTLDGEADIIVHVWTDTTSLVLHSESITINESLTVLTARNGTQFRPEIHYYATDTEMLHLVFKDQVTPGLYTLHLSFTSLMSDDLYGCYNSFYKTESGDETWVTLTHLQPIYARRVFPCWDEPAIKATFKISLKHFPNHTALSNMPVFSEELDESDGKVWTHFRTTPIMSTNIIAFALVDYGVVSNEDESIRVWSKRDLIPHVRYAIDIAESATNILQLYLNSTVSVPKTDLVTVPDYSSRATENWGLIVFAERALVFNPETQRVVHKLYNIMTIVHEVAHQWFGNLVSPRWWKYLWMSEGMATYLKYFIGDKINDKWRLMENFVVRDQQAGAFVADARYSTTIINRDVESPSELRRRDPFFVYTKPSVILRMLSHIVSEDVFRAGLMKYIKRNEYVSVTSEDLWRAMQSALDESGRGRDDFGIRNVMNTWIEQPGYPIVIVTRNYEAGTVDMRQISVNTVLDPTAKVWWIPLSYTTKSTQNFYNTTPTHWLEPGVSTTTIGNISSDDWIIINLQQAGYYRVAYDNENWRKIADHLNCDDYTKIHVLNRAQLIDDCIYLTTERQLHLNTSVQIFNYLARETDYIAWYPMLRTLDRFVKYLALPEAEVIKTYLIHLITNLLETTGFEDRPEDNELQIMARAEILQIACRIGHPECKRKATERLVAYIENPEENKIKPDYEYWTYCMGLMQANQSIWNRVLEMHKDNLNVDILEYLGCSEDPHIIDNYLNMSLDGHTDISKTFTNVAISSINYESSIHTDRIIDFIIRNWNGTHPPSFDRHYVLDRAALRAQTPEQFRKLQSFMEQVGMTFNRNLLYRERVLVTVHRCIEAITRVLRAQNAGREEDPTFSGSHNCPNLL